MSDNKYLRCVRTGKTLKDHKSGAWGNRFSNQSARESWQKDSKRATFPKTTCNGKRNRHRYTGKKGVTIVQ